MPAVVKKPTPKATAKPPAVKIGQMAEEVRPILYPKITINGIEIPDAKMRLGATLLKALIGWETEKDYKARCERSTDQTVRAKGIAGYGDEYMLTDSYGEKVRCWNNLDNRPFDPGTADKYAQDELNREWAGPAMHDNHDVELPLAEEKGGGTITVPLFTVNGETIVVGRTGKVMSGQHRIVGGILAAERWNKDKKAYPLWTEEPYLESLVVFGVSEDPAVVKTLDNVRPRKLSDTIYTSDVFRYVYANGQQRLANAKERQELSVMLDAAIDLLWKRTGAGGDNEPTHRFQTHSTSFDFLDRHGGKEGRLCKAVKHIYESNSPDSGRTLSKDLSLSPGQCAAALYLMGSSASDIAEYLKDRTEKHLDWSLWDKAEEFFTFLADPTAKDFEPVRDAIGALFSVEPGELGLLGRSEEKLAVLAAAWNAFHQDADIQGNDVEVNDGGLKLAYAKDKNGKTVLLDPPTFGGIDLGPNPDPPDRVSPKQAEAAKAKAQKEKADNVLKAARGKPVAGGSALEVLNKLKEDHPNCIMLFRDDTGDYNVYGPDAETVKKEMALEKMGKGPGGVPMVTVAQSWYETCVKQMMAAGHMLKVVAYTDGEATVTEVQPRKSKPGGTPAPTAPAKPKPGPKATANKPAPKSKPGGKKEPVPLKGGIG